MKGWIALGIAAVSLTVAAGADGVARGRVIQAQRFPSNSRATSVGLNGRALTPCS
jgi:hypothetical protein